MSSINLILGFDYAVYKSLILSESVNNQDPVPFFSVVEAACAFLLHLTSFYTYFFNKKVILKLINILQKFTRYVDRHNKSIKQEKVTCSYY